MKTYYIDGLDCANCAMRIENKLNELEIFESAFLNFAAGEIRVNPAEGAEEPFEIICTVVRQLEPDATVFKSKPAASHPTNHSHQHGHSHARSGQLRRLLPVITLIAAAVMLIPAVIFSGETVSSVLFLTSGLLAGWQIFWKGLKKLRHFSFDENILLLIAFIAAFVIGEYFEACMVVLLFSLGEMLEELAVSRSKRSIEALTRIRPETATVLRDGRPEELPCESVKVGDLILIKPGERVPLDCEIVSGESQSDNSAITGESVPVTVSPGDQLLSGGINLTAALQARVTHSFIDSTASRIIDMVKNSAARKGNTETYISHFAKIYTPIVILAAVVLAVIPPLLGLGSFSQWIYTALIFLVASCPCALVISVPLSFFSCIGAESRIGVLIKGGKYIEALAKLDTIAFDKTGTLTTGRLSVEKAESYHPDYSSEQLLRLAAACEQYSTHPIAVSITEAVSAEKLPKAEEYKEIRGMGISAVLESIPYLCGGKRLLEQNGFDTASLPHANIYLADNEKKLILGGISVRDTLREESKSVLSELGALGVNKAVILSGDNEAAVKRCAQELHTDYQAGLMPEDKLRAIETVRQSARKTAFIGDGINDAPVLAAADVGIAMGLGSDSAIEAADAVLVSGTLAPLPRAIRLAKKCMRIIYFNVTLALVTKLAVFALALFGLGEMWMAVVADVGVSIISVLNAARLLHKK